MKQRTTPHRCSWTGLALALLGSGCAVPPATPLMAGDFAIVDVAVIPMDRERVDVNRTVVVADGRIAAVAPSDAVRLAPGVRRVNGRGKFLIPGLADMHVHLLSDSAGALYVANGVTLVRNMWGAAATLERRRRFAAGELLGPRVITAGPLTDGDPPIWSSSQVAADAAEACAQMAQQQKQGYDFLKIYNRISSETFDGIVACSRATGFPFAGHVPNAVGLERMVLGGARSIEHLSGYEDLERRADGPLRARGDYANGGERLADRVSVAQRVQRGELAWSDVFDPQRREDVAMLAAREHVWNVPTLFVTKRIFTARGQVAEEMQRPEMRYVRPLVKAFWNPDNDFRKKSLDDRELALLGTYFSQDLERVRVLKRAGAPLLAGTDAPNPFVVHGFAIHEELALLVQAGLTPYEALSAATTAPARFLGEQGHSGVVAPGARADLVLLDANPLADIGATRGIAGVALAGRWLPREALQQALARVEAGFAIPEDWFADVSPPPGLSAAAVRMQVHTSGIENGAQRHDFAADGRGWRLLAQRALRINGDVVVTMNARAGADGLLESVDYRREGINALDARLRREGGTIVLEGATADGTAVTARAPAAPYVGCDLAACVAPLLPALRVLAPGAQREVPVLAVVDYPQLALKPERWTLTRDPDPARSEAKIEARRGKATRGLRVRWDARGLVSVTADSSWGDVETRRLDAP